MSILKFKYTGLALVALLLCMTLLACGDSPTAVPAATSSATKAPSLGGTTGAAPVLNTPAGGTATTAAATTAASSTGTTAAATTAAATTASGAGSVAGTTAAGQTTAAASATTVATGAGGTSTAANPCLDTVAAASPTTAAAAGPKPTTTVTDLATVPNLAYNGQKALTAQDATSQGIIANLGDAQYAAVFGSFTPDKVSFAASSDSYDKVDAFLRQTLESNGWDQFHVENDATNKQSLLVYQKGGSKVIVSMETVGSDTSQYPAEFQASLKTGDTLILIATGKVGQVVTPTPFAIPGSPTPAVAAGQNLYATIEMEKGGTIVIQLCPNLAPKTVENFEKLATANFYNGLTFHRVEKSPTPFVVQGGDPKGDGTGGPGYTIPDEFTKLKKHTRGTVAMAHSAAANSAGSQFYICLADAPFLDGQYAIFGQVISGMDVVDNIAVGDKMKSVTITVK